MPESQTGAKQRCDYSGSQLWQKNQFRGLKINTDSQAFVSRCLHHKVWEEIQESEFLESTSGFFFTTCKRGAKKRHRLLQRAGLRGWRSREGACPRRAVALSLAAVGALGGVRGWSVGSEGVGCTRVGHAPLLPLWWPASVTPGADGLNSFTGSQGHILKPRSPPELRTRKEEMLQTRASPGAVFLEF